MRSDADHDPAAPVAGVAVSPGAVPDGPAGDAMGDAIDTARADWARVRPDLDLAAMESAGRVFRIAAILERCVEAPLADLGLTRGEFDLLSALRRAEHALSPGELRTVGLASGAAISKRLHTLGTRGLIARERNPADGRGVLVRITESGVALADRAVVAVDAAERAALAGFGADHPAVVDSLRRMLSVLDRRESPPS